MARPPAHPNCRSTTVAVTKSWKELGFDMEELPAGTRASMDGQVPADMTYYDWLRRQPVDIQKDVLGKKRWEMWHNDGVSPDRFVNDEGRLLTLDQLRKRMGKDLDALGPAPIADRMPVPDAPPGKRIDEFLDPSSDPITSMSKVHDITEPEDFLGAGLSPKEFGVNRWPSLEELNKLSREEYGHFISDVKLQIVHSTDMLSPQGMRAAFRTRMRQFMHTHKIGDVGDVSDLVDIKLPDLPRLDIGIRKTFDHEVRGRAAIVEPEWPEIDPQRSPSWKVQAVKEARQGWAELPDFVKAQVSDGVPFEFKMRARAHFDPASQRLVLSDLDTPDVLVHEMFHALDFKFRTRVGAKTWSGERGSLDWVTSDSKLNALAKAAREEFIRRNSKGKGSLRGGDGAYSLGDWHHQYEGRIYQQDDDVGSEYLAMNAQYYLKARTNPGGRWDTYMRQRAPAIKALFDYIWSK